MNGEAGYVDGSARQSKLSHPVSCTVAHGSIYFIEQGRIPAVKLYDGDQVKTIYSGSPLKNLTDICAGENGTLLICDRGNSCIWKLEIASGELFPLVTKSDLAGNDEINSSFLPSGIVKVADGAYLFSDLFRHQIFRLMTSECVMDSLHASHLTYSSLEELSSQSSHVIINYLSAAETLKQDVLHGVARLWRMKETILNFQYSSEIQRLAPFLTQKSSPKEGLAFFLRNAPSYVAIERLLRSISVTPDILFKLQESMALFAQEYDFSSPLIVVEKELTALANIFQMALPIAGQELFCKILKDER